MVGCAVTRVLGLRDLCRGVFCSSRSASLRSVGIVRRGELHHREARTSGSAAAAPGGRFGVSGRSPSGSRAARPFRSAGSRVRVGRRKIGSRQLTATDCAARGVMPSDGEQRGTASPPRRRCGSGSCVFRSFGHLPVRARELDVEQVVLHVGERLVEKVAVEDRRVLAAAHRTSPRLPGPGPPCRAPWRCPRRSGRASSGGIAGRRALVVARVVAHVDPREDVRQRAPSRSRADDAKPLRERARRPFILAAQGDRRSVLLEDGLLHGPRDAAGREQGSASSETSSARFMSLRASAVTTRWVAKLARVGEREQVAERERRPAPASWSRAPSRERRHALQREHEEDQQRRDRRRRVDGPAVRGIGVARGARRAARSSRRPTPRRSARASRRSPRARRGSRAGRRRSSSRSRAARSRARARGRGARQAVLERVPARLGVGALRRAPACAGSRAAPRARS